MKTFNTAQLWSGRGASVTGEKSPSDDGTTKKLTDDTRLYDHKMAVTPRRCTPYLLCKTLSVSTGFGHNSLALSLCERRAATRASRWRLPRPSLSRE
ncbi:unnamed protein product, partial [Iphiclides podalirius]